MNKKEYDKKYKESKWDNFLEYCFVIAGLIAVLEVITLAKTILVKIL